MSWRFLQKQQGIRTVRKFVQNLPHPDSRTFVGKGKLAEIKEFVIADKVTHVIFDDDLTPSQLRTLRRSSILQLMIRIR
jgi:GTP-binding protein HflX